MNPRVHQGSYAVVSTEWSLSKWTKWYFTFRIDISGQAAIFTLWRINRYFVISASASSVPLSTGPQPTTQPELHKIRAGFSTKVSPPNSGERNPLRRSHIAAARGDPRGCWGEWISSSKHLEIPQSVCQLHHWWASKLLSRRILGHCERVWSACRLGRCLSRACIAACRKT